MSEYLKPGKYAILYRDDRDGEGDTYHCLASLSDDGIWHDEEFNAELLQHEGDAILKAWPLDDGSNVLALVEALEKAQRHERLTEAERQAYLGLISQRDERIASLESRTVTVKLPEVEKWRKPDAVRAQNAYRILTANELAAAGIQVIEGEVHE